MHVQLDNSITAQSQKHGISAFRCKAIVIPVQSYNPVNDYEYKILFENYAIPSIILQNPRQSKAKRIHMPTYYWAHIFYVTV